MGCFSYTCWLSDLTISAGDPVKYFWLADNPYSKNHVCASHDMWFPRTGVIDARYNDYGSIEDYDETGPGVASMLLGLERDLVERGTGDNQCHDVPVRRRMTFEQALNAVQEGRILVSRNTDRNTGGGESDYPEPEWRPTLQNVTELLQHYGYRVNGDDACDDEHLLVDERHPGWIRVRRGGFGQRRDLSPILHTVQTRFAACITAGRDSWADEIQVFPKPGDPKDEERRAFRYDAPGNRWDRKAPLRVWQCMIHKPIWDRVILTRYILYTLNI